jgi:hypothetical protein
MWFVSPRAGERYYLQLHLHTVKCPLGFDQLKDYDGVQYETYQEPLEREGFWKAAQSCMSAYERLRLSVWSAVPTPIRNHRMLSRFCRARRPL